MILEMRKHSCLVERIPWLIKECKVWLCKKKIGYYFVNDSLFSTCDLWDDITINLAKVSGL